VTRAPFVRAQEIMATLDISRAAAYELMHNLRAVRIGEGSLRLARENWDRYLRELQKRSALPPTQAVTVDGATSAEDVPEPRRDPSEPPPISARRRKVESPAVLRHRAQMAARAKRDRERRK
jgi:hypothetical protein